MGSPAGLPLEARQRALGVELDALKARIMARVGDDDVRYVQRLDRVSKTLEVVGRTLIHVSPDPLSFGAGVIALWLHKQLQATEIGHTALHGAYDKLANAEAFASESFAWDVPIDEESWRAGHNIKHHGNTNIAGKDPDVDFGPIRLTEHTPHERAHNRQLFQTLFVLFPNFTASMNLHFTGLADVFHDNGHSNHMDVLHDRSPESVRFAWRRALRKYVPYYLKNYAFFPALAGPLWPKVLLGNWLAETLRDLYTAASIIPGHVGPEVASWPEGTKAQGRGCLVRDADRGDQRLRGAAPALDPVRRPRQADRAPPVPDVGARAPARDRARGPRDSPAPWLPLSQRELGSHAEERARAHQRALEEQRHAGRAARGRMSDGTRAPTSDSPDVDATVIASEAMTTETAQAEWTIDDLGREARLPTRTIRFYQARGALMRPEIRGRVAFYGPAHVERLRLIAQLQDRGLRIEAIRDLVGRIDRGELDLGQWLGVEQQVQSPWAAGDQARTVDEAGVYALAGSERPGLLAELVRARLIARRGEVYLVPSPSLLQIALRFEAAGIELGVAAKAAEAAQKHLGKAVNELVSIFVKGVREGTVALADPDALFSTLRPLGTEAVALMFARAMDRALRKLVADDGLGQLATPPKKTAKPAKAPPKTRKTR